MKAYFSLVSIEQAYAALETFTPLDTERIDARLAAGRVVAEQVRACEDVPAFRRANMDGYAVRSTDVAEASESACAALVLCGAVDMGAAAACRVEPGTAVRVATGAMLPEGADAVVPWEQTETADGARVLVRSPVRPGQNIVEIAEDIAAGDVLFEPGRRLRGGDVGALTGVGRSHIEVFRRPRVGVVVTGDEIVEPEAELAAGQVRNVNQYALASLARLAGAEVHEYGVIPDEEATLRDAVARAIAQTDVVFISGGSSKGERDLTRATIERLGGDVLVHGIAIAPGKPTIIARAGDCAVMGVPGNPAAAVVVFTLLGSALLRVREGEPLTRILALRPRAFARLTAAAASTPGRETYLRVRLEPGADGSLEATPIPGKSVAISTVARADALLRVRADETIAAGTSVEVLLL